MRTMAVAVWCAWVWAVPQAAPQDIVAAVQAGKVDAVQALLARDSSLAKATDSFGNGLLRLAVLRDDVAMADLLIHAGLDVNAERADLGGSLLITAAGGSSLDIVKLLVAHGADLERKTGRGQTAVTRAILAQRKPTVDFLLARGATLHLDVAPAITLLRGALAGGMSDVAGRIITEKVIDYGARDGLARTLLHFTAQSPAAPLARMLIDKGLSSDARDLFGWTPLHMAAHAGQLAMVDALLAAGATKDLRTFGGRTAYNLAEAAGRKDVAARLAALKCDTRPPAFPDLRSPYIDGTLPTGSPRMFAPDIVSDPNAFEHSAMAFSRDLQALAWSVGIRTEVSTIMLMERHNGRWTAPAPLLSGASRPAFSADGRRLFFNAARTLADGSRAGDDDIFYIERTKTGWSAPVNLGPGVNTERDDRSPSLTADDTLYFERESRLYRAVAMRGTYAEATALPLDEPAVNGFVARDEGYLLYQQRGAPFPAKVTFPRPDGSWSAGIELPETMAPRGALFPSVTPDGKYFFMADPEGVRWTDAKALAALRATGDASVPATRYVPPPASRRPNPSRQPSGERFSVSCRTEASRDDPSSREQRRGHLGEDLRQARHRPSRSTMTC